MHDEHYKRFFAFPAMVKDLLSAFVPEAVGVDFDFSTLRKLSAEYVGDEQRVRRGDTVWRVRHGAAQVHVLVLLEFQSTDDRDMALRILEYTVLLYRELGRNRDLEPDGLRPPVLPVVLYNGDTPWRAKREVRELIAPVGPDLAPHQPSQRYVVLDERHVRRDDVAGSSNLMAAVMALEQTRSAEDPLRVAQALLRRQWDESERELAELFVAWILRLEDLMTSPDEPRLPRVTTLEELTMTLEARVAELPKQWMQEGLEQGLAQGLEQGLDQQRALLCRLTVARFGDETASRLAEVLAGLSDPERLAEVGEWIVQCETADDLLARAGAAPAGGNGQRR